MKHWIEVSHVSKRFYAKKNWLQKKIAIGGLEDISFSSSCGSLAILGESGSGKTTLVKLISGIDTYESGVIKLFDYKNTETKKVSLIFQDYTTSINPEFSIKKALMESLEQIDDISIALDQMKLILNRVGLSKLDIDKKVIHLSGGEIQRVCIARSLLSNADILIFDEAFSSLDLLVTDQLLDLLIELQQEFSLRYILVTHDLELACYFCEQIIFMREGKLIESLLTKNLMTTHSEYILSLIDAQI